MRECDGRSLVSVATALEWSLSSSVAVTFFKTTSSGYSTAVAVARRADRYAEQLVSGKLFHVASFGVTQPQLSFAIFVIETMRRSSVFQVFAGGKLVQDPWRVTEVIECVLSAGNNADPRAHCVVESLFPCRLLYQRGFRPVPSHPSPIGAQIYAAAVREGCDWCPHLGISG